MNIERLRHLQKILQEFTGGYVPEGQTGKVKFNMGVWKLKEGCGTVCCAAGLATMDPEFQAAGLGAELSNITQIEAGEETTHRYCPKVGEAMGLSALKLFFGLSLKEAGFIFMPKSYNKPIYTITPKYVIEHIEIVIDTYAIGQRDSE